MRAALIWPLLLWIIQPAKAYDRPEMIALLEGGTWGWTTAAQVCQTDTRQFRFSDDMTAMVNVVVDEGIEVEYQILSHDSNSIRMRIIDEDRMTDDGEPVVWNLRFGGPNGFCLHRTDWPLLACTPWIIRCPSENLGS